MIFNRVREALTENMMAVREQAMLKSLPGREENKHKVPRAGMCLFCLRNPKAADVAG